ncbi:MAG: hypothetical protein LZ172_05560 [Thaumarchaeota archaeon]|jgi:putative serine/threonine protein kinase|nr:hypothetical protein [Candidatus Geocrenenecus arthurdayi]MCL7391295.1 hypothetical protein [Candidatus Geocrenenecus arthurdayi]MCL7396281.1 hypothetical protein [Candidatus Geocrenenecus arthurdayi]MCL7403794.1 hypothetical protein [Candidatus Geocrenenecus arthurdayi]
MNLLKLAYHSFNNQATGRHYLEMTSQEDSEISLEELSFNRELLIQLAYPSGAIDYAMKILRELREMNVDSVYVVHEPKPSLKFIGKGYRGVILKARWKNKIVAGKILRIDSGISTLVREAEMMKMANSTFVGPLLFDYSEHVILMEYIQGVDLDRWLNNISHNDVYLLKVVLESVLVQTRRLDCISLDHGELSNARRHVIVREDLHPIILDFGKARISRKPKNVTSIVSYLIHGPHHNKILSMLEVKDFPILVLKNYKENPCEENFKKILRELNLTGKNASLSD